MSLIVRNVQLGDLNFIRDSFVKSVRKIPITVGLDGEILRNLIDRAILFNWKATVLCEQSEPTEIMAWLISEPTHRRVFYLLRNAKYRAVKGLGMKLLEQTIPRGSLYCAFVQPAYAAYFAECGYDIKLRPYVTAEVLSYE